MDKLTNQSHSERKTHILNEVHKLLYTYGLNKVVRYGLERKEIHQTQSLAEHVTNIMFCAYYFRDLEDPKHEMDFEKVLRFILMHDMAEIEVGDVLTVNRVAANNEREKEALTQVAQKSPDFVAREIKEVFEGFENPKSAEERFARAMDKFEGFLFWFTDDGIRMIKTVSSNDVIRGYFEKLEPILEKLGFPSVIEHVRVMKEDVIRRGLLD